MIKGILVEEVLVEVPVILSLVVYVTGFTGIRKKWNCCYGVTDPRKDGNRLSFYLLLQTHHSIANPRQSVERKTRTRADFFFWLCGGAYAARYIIELDSSPEAEALSLSLIPVTLRLRKEKEPQDLELIELRFREHMDRNIAAAMLAFLEKKSALTLPANELMSIKAGFMSWGILSRQPLRHFKENDAIDVAFFVYEESQGRQVISVHSSAEPEQKIVVETQVDTISVKNYEVTAKPVPCLKGCSKTFTSQKGLNGHFCPPVPCPKGCSKTFTSQKGLASHRCGTDLLVCPNGCSNTFTSQKGLNDHFCPPVPCPKGCSKTFASQSGLARHHCGTDLLVCPKGCSKTFTSQNGLANHRCGTVLLGCPKGCSRTFTTQNGLARHRCGTDLLGCPKGCSRTFTTQNGLARHRCGTDQLVCPKGCSKTFTSQSGLNVHFCPPVPCPKGCSKTFTSQNGLARHRCGTAKPPGRVRQTRKRKSVKRSSDSGISATKKLKLEK